MIPISKWLFDKIQYLSWNPFSQHNLGGRVIEWPRSFNSSSNRFFNRLSVQSSPNIEYWNRQYTRFDQYTRDRSRKYANWWQRIIHNFYLLVTNLVIFLVLLIQTLVFYMSFIFLLKQTQQNCNLKRVALGFWFFQVYIIPKIKKKAWVMCEIAALYAFMVSMATWLSVYSLRG